jgi:hypothetical protein
MAAPDRIMPVGSTSRAPGSSSAPPDELFSTLLGNDRPLRDCVVIGKSHKCHAEPKDLSMRLRHSLYAATGGERIGRTPVLD